MFLQMLFTDFRICSFANWFALQELAKRKSSRIGVMDRLRKKSIVAACSFVSLFNPFSFSAGDRVLSKLAINNFTRVNEQNGYFCKITIGTL